MTTADWIWNTLAVLCAGVLTFIALIEVPS